MWIDNRSFRFAGEDTGFISSNGDFAVGISEVFQKDLRAVSPTSFPDQNIETSFIQVFKQDETCNKIK